MEKRLLLLILIITWFELVKAGPGPGFIENKNQWNTSIDYMAAIPGGRMMVGAGQFTYSFLDNEKIQQLHDQTHDGFSEINLTNDNGPRIGGRKVNVNFVNSNSAARPTAANKFVAYYNYFLGDDPGKWASKARAFGEVTYTELYPGIDMQLKIVGQNIKYDLIVSAEADPTQIVIAYTGARSVVLHNGDLVVDAEYTEIIEKKPIAFQWINGQKRFISCEYTLVGDQMSFNFPDGYDPCYELTIDPLLIFSTYSGFTADNWGSSATPGEHGFLYSAGVTNESTFGGDFYAFNSQSEGGPFQLNYGGNYDVAIYKYDSVGYEMHYASFLGGSDAESPHSLVMNSNNELLILGTTSSTNFPTTAGSVDQTYNEVAGQPVTHVVQYSNGSDIFVTKVSADGSQMLASTYLGGSSVDGLNSSSSPLVANYGDQLRGDIITDEANNIYISTVSASADFPVQNSFNTTYKGGTTDAVVMKLSANLDQIIWGAFVGGAGVDASHTIKFNSTGQLVVGGGTTSTDFPITAGSYQEINSGGVDGWMAKLENDGSGIIASTFTGTSSFDQVYFIDLNKDDEIYVYGQTSGPMPITAGAYNNPNSGQFVQKFNAELTSLMFSTVFGSGIGIPNISPTAFLVNDCNNIYMTGWGGQVNQNNIKYWNSDTKGMPVTADAFQSTTSGSDFYFIVLTDDATQFLYGTYMGGNRSRTHVDGGTSRFDKGGIVYHAVCSGCAAYNAFPGSSSDFPTTDNVWSDLNNSKNCNNAAFKFDLSSLRARLIPNSLALDHPGLTQLCIPDKLVFQNRSIGGEVFEWDFGDGTNDIKVDTTAIVHQYQAAGVYKVRLRAVDAGTCAGEDFDFATITVNKATGVVGGDQTICFGSQALLFAGGGTAYEWKALPDSIVSTVAQPSLNPKDTTRYVAKVTDVNGCIVKDTLTVNVVPGIDLKFDVRKIADCNSRPELKVINRTSEMEEVFFDFGDGNTSTDNDVLYSYKNDGRYNVRLVGKKEFCVYEESVDLPFFTIKVPNVITPGSPDGRNDSFRIRYGAAEDSPTTTEAGVKVALTIYNRWGKVVYQNPEYGDEWDGAGLESGTYYYEAEIENEPTCKGWVQIVK